jgi:predicted DNA-binding WGR domain protein
MLLHRINPEKNEARYYRVEVRPYISGLHPPGWGRIGRRRRAWFFDYAMRFG